MKQLSLITLITLLLFGTSYSNSSNSNIFAKHDHEYITKEFKVFGNCGMCENKIEKAAISLDGVKTAEWNSETKTIKITFDEHRVKLENIHKAIALAGYDTELVKASDKVYNNLPGCCQYDREKE